MPEHGDEQPNLDTSTYAQSARQALKNQDYETAIKDFKKAIHRNNEDPSLYYSLGLSYERKGIHEKEEAFLKMAWDSYITAFYKNLFENDVVDGLIRIAAKLARFDELVRIIKEKIKLFPDSSELKEALKKVSTVSMLSIPDVKQSSSKETGLLYRILIDYLMPVSGIFLLLLGGLIPKYAPRSILNRFSSVMVCIGLLLFLFYFFIKLIKTPQRTKRKNW